jgi:hypothetical protein
MAMIDPFVLLTPILLLGIVALLAFVGCQDLFDVSGVHTPTIDVNQVTPAGGPSAGGTPVQIFGSGFTDVEQVTFGGVNTTSFSVISDTEVDTTTPPNSPGPANVVVTVSGGFANSTSPTFTYDAVGFVQPGSSAQGTNPPIAVKLNNTTQGNLLIAAVSYGGPAAGSVTVSDNLGNSFILAGSGPWFRQSRIFYLPNIPGGTVTITATGAGGATGPCSMCVSEYSGADATGAAIYGFSTHASPSTGTAGVETMQGVAVTPAQSGDIVYLVVFAAQSTSLVAGPGFVSHLSTTPSLLVEDNTAAVALADPVATDDTTGGSFVPWVVLAVAIKA